VESEILKQDATLAEIVRRLVEAYQPAKVYLFGSKARGDAGPDSDYDIMVVVPSSDKPPTSGHARPTRFSTASKRRGRDGLDT